jgi:hypothetical protein
MIRNFASEVAGTPVGVS